MRSTATWRSDSTLHRPAIQTGTAPQMRDRAFFYFRDPTCLQAVPEALRRSVYVETDAVLMEKLADLKKQLEGDADG